MMIKDPNGEVFKINKSCESILGYTEEELLKIGLSSLLHPDDIEETSELLDGGIKAHQSLNFISRYKNDSYRTLEWHSTTAEDGFTHAFAKDITARSNALEKIKNQNKEKVKRAAELAIANEELKFQNHEKEKRADELAIAMEELLFQNDEKGKRAAELAIANEELFFQNHEKEKRTAYNKL